MPLRIFHILIMVFAVSVLITACSDQSPRTAANRGKPDLMGQKQVPLSGQVSGNMAGEVTGNEPRISFEELKYDFGKIEQNAKVSHSFRFTNTGKSKLVIEDIKTTCGCTAAASTSREVSPGETGAIDVTLDSGNFQGRISKAVMIYTNDQTQRLVKIYVDALVAVEIEVQPASLFFGKVYYNDTSQKELYLVNHMENKDLQISKIELSPQSEFFSWKHTKIDNNKYQIDVNIKPGAPIGNLYSNLVIHTNSTKQSQVKVSLKAEIQGDITVNPERISFGIVAPGTPVHRKTVISHKKLSNFQITRVTVETAQLLTELKPVENGKSYELTVTVPENIASNIRLSGAITLQTNNKVQPSIVIPYYGVVRDKTGDTRNKDKQALSGQKTDR